MKRLKRTIKTTIQIPISLFAIIFILGIALCATFMYCVEYVFDEE